MVIFFSVGLKELFELGRNIPGRGRTVAQVAAIGAWNLSHGDTARSS